MRFVMFYQSLISDWNHGNAHFLRGIAGELLRRGHQVAVFEPEDGWSRTKLLADQGPAPLAAFARAYPELAPVAHSYRAPETLDLDQTLAGADVVIVHEWSAPELVARIGAHHARSGGYALFFHDTHHRSVTDAAAMAAYDLSGYDGVLAFGAPIRDIYLARGWSRAAWVWHEAADTTHFRPMAGPPVHDLIWIGNWGDGERAAELHEFLIEPVRRLGLLARVHGVRYPDHARQALADAGIEYAGWLPNFEVPAAFARARVTVHVPRRPYVEALPGIPTIRPFEALACGIPLVSAPWRDDDRMFRAGEDYLVARDGDEMRLQLEAVLTDEWLATRLSASGLRTIAARHTCRHRVDELLAIVESTRTDALGEGMPAVASGAARAAS